jgi:hypothetical protein
MARDIVDLVEPFLSEDPTRWGKLSSDVQWRRLQLLLLREILLELREINRKGLHEELTEEKAAD